MKTTNPLVASERQLAALFDMDRAALAQAIREAGIPRTKRGYDVKRVLALMVGTGTLDAMAPSARHQLARAHYMEMRVAEKARQLIPMHEVERGHAEIFKRLALFLDTLPCILERDCGLPTHALKRLDEAVDKARTELRELVNAPSEGDDQGDAP
jgi:hypothetical protein